MRMGSSYSFRVTTPGDLAVGGTLVAAERESVPLASPRGEEETRYARRSASRGESWGLGDSAALAGELVVGSSPPT